MRVDHGSREIVCKVVYCGPGMSGKTTNLQFIHDRAPRQAVGEMVSIDTESERTLHFDLLPLDLGTVQGYRCRFEFYTVPGQTYYGATRRMVLEGTDGVVFVADSRRDMLDENVDSLNDLFENLHHHDLPSDLPMVVQYNKQDLPDALAPDQLKPLLNPRMVPDYSAVATTGSGVLETMKRITQLVIDRVSAQEKLGDGRAGTASGSSPSPAKQSGQSSWIITCHNCESLLEVPHADPGDIFSCGSCGAPLEVVDADRGTTRQPARQTGRRAAPPQHPAPSPDLTPVGEETGFSMQALPERSPLRSSALTSTPEPASGSHQALPSEAFIIEGYQAVARLDESLLGQRYRVRDTASGRFQRALIMNPAVIRQPGFSESLEPALSLASQCQSPSLLPVSGLRAKDGYKVVLYADAPDHEPLNHVLARRRLLQPAQALTIIQQLAIGLDAASRRGAVHGWLRPDVVLLNPEGNVLLDEMGIPKPHAYLLRESMGASAATEHYLAPEHLLNDSPSDIRTDMFFLGALLFRMLSGEGLVTGYSAHEALHKVAASGPRSVRSVNSEIPRDVDNFCARLTAVERRDRFQNYQELIKALTSLSVHRHNPTLKLTRGVPQPVTRGTRRTTARTGTGPITRGHRRRSGSGTGPIRSGTGPIRSGTGPIHSGTGTGPLPAGSRARTTGSHHHGGHRKRGNGGLIAVLVILVLVAIGAAAFVLTENQRQVPVPPPQRSVEEPTPAPREPTAPGTERPADTRPDQGEPIATTTEPAEPSGEDIDLVRRARELVERYRTSEHDPELLAEARAAVAAIQDVDRRAWNGLRANLDMAMPATVNIGGEESPTQERSTETLAAADVERLETLIGEERYGDALAFLDRLGLSERARRGRSAEIDQRHASAREQIQRQAQASGDPLQAGALIDAAIARWNMPADEGDEAWGRALLATIDASAPEQTPSDQEAAPVIAQPGGADGPQHSPGGLLLSALRIDRAIDDALAAGDHRTVERLLADLPPDASESAAIEHKVQLWNRRHQILNEVIAARAPRLRIVPPIGDSPWDVLSATAAQVQIKQPGGGSMQLDWAQVSRPQLGDLFAAAANGPDARQIDLAMAAVANLIARKPGPAALFVTGAKRAGYEHAAHLEVLLEMMRERQVVELLAAADEAVASNDPARIEAIIEGLATSARASHPTVSARIAELREIADRLSAGHTAPPTAGGSTAGRDRLTFDSPEDRSEGFSQRSGIWAIQNGRIENSGDASLARDDLGNARAVAVNFQVATATGAVTINFRGTRLIADFGNGSLLLSSPGERRNPMDFPLQANTEYAVYMALQADGRVRIEINQTQPMLIEAGRLTSQLRIACDTGAVARIDEIVIQRGEAGTDTAQPVNEQQAILRQMGFEPLGGAFKDPDSTAFVLPPGGDRSSGIGIPLREGVQGYSLRINGTGSMTIGVGYIEDGVAVGDSYTVDLAGLNAPAQEVTVTRSAQGFDLRIVQEGAGPVAVELPAQERNEHVFITVSGSARIATTPRTLR